MANTNATLKTTVSVILMSLLAFAALYVTLGNNDGAVLHRTSSAPAAAAAAVLSGPGSYELLYYFDVEPKEQKYLRFGTTYEQMVRRRAVNPASPTAAVHLSANAVDTLSQIEHPLAVSGRLALPNIANPNDGADGSRALVTSARAEAMRESLQSLKIRQLRRMLKEKDASCEGCVEKHHLVERILEVRGWLSREDANMLALAVLQDSVVARPLPYHLGGARLSAEEAVSVVQRQDQEAVLRNGLDCSQQHMGNMTVVCVPKANVQ
jgi:hypothetical protein